MKLVHYSVEELFRVEKNSGFDAQAYGKGLFHTWLLGGDGWGRGRMVPLSYL